MSHPNHGHLNPAYIGQRNGRRRMDIILGVDFGTRFTKVAYRIVEVDSSEIVIPNAGNPESAFFPSMVYFGEDGSISSTQGSGRRPLPYLKMLLKDPSQPPFVVPTELQKKLSPENLPPIAAAYLSWVIRQAMAVIVHNERRRLGGHDLHWTINLSVPAQYLDDGAAARFQEVGRVAMRWAQAPILKNETLAELSRRFADDAKRPVEVEVSVFAEIVAALHHFISSRDTPEGLHGFIDIGGGTLDGCVFHLTRPKGAEPLIKILAAKVEALGTIVISKKATALLYLRRIESDVEPKLLSGAGTEKSIILPLDQASGEIVSFVGTLMNDARLKMPGDTLQHDGAAAFDHSIKQPRNDFTVHMTGGGAISDWYRITAQSAYEKCQHDRNGIMPYRFVPLRANAGLSRDVRLPFSRFIIAHGLTNEPSTLERYRVRLPSQLASPPPLPAAVNRAPNYADTKDIYDR